MSKDIMQMYKYVAKVHKDGQLVEEVIETTEDITRVQMHAHIHSIQHYEEYEKDLKNKEKDKDEKNKK